MKMWDNNRQVISVEDRIKRHEKDFLEHQKQEHKKEDILNELRKTRLWHYYPVRIRSWDWLYNVLNLSLYDVPVEMVIDFFCGHLHRVYGIDWKMIPTSGHIELHSKYKDINIRFEVHEESMQACEIKRYVTRVRSDKELNVYRYEYRYEMDCGKGG